MIKKIVRKLLGKDLRQQPPVYLEYIDNITSILRSGFSLRLDDPIKEKKYIYLGKESIVSCNIIFESKEGIIKIGNRNSIGNSTFICRNEIILEDNIFISWGCTICDHGFHSLNYEERRDDFLNIWENITHYRNVNRNKNWNTVDSKPIRICSDSWIGMNCTIMKGVTIGKGAIVRANSVVTKDVPEFTVVAGNPAQIIKKLKE